MLIKYIIIFTNKKNGIRSPKNPGIKKVSTKIGTIIIRPIVRILGILSFIFLFVLASFTDYLDGLLARMFKEESKLGELLDPIADKILVAAALILLVMNETIKNYEVIAAIIILTREILISGLREFLAKGSIQCR